MDGWGWGYFEVGDTGEIMQVSACYGSLLDKKYCNDKHFYKK